ncbi:hypothetical protein HDC92_002428 [Pedobacter sp. AK017]|uniref:hypothetical protein n=1 Tax=Pedobacter sp. AK017 TaxID=2723073 RepID=UPI0016096E62|nr:hypothetical protein [Pedobacter sp. AK017]MBB5438747.1 hypothetical protein [Pedobacter sp. AK017]
MVAQEKEHSPIKFREVFLSDLKSIVNLYRTQKTIHSTGLNADFGLPLGIAELNCKIIAYAFVNINDAGKAVVQVHTDKELAQDQVCETLKNISLKRFKAQWTFDDNGISTENHVKNAISRLVNWLNNCYQ